MNHSFKETLAVKGKKKSVQVSSVAQSCPTLCDPVDCSMPGFSVHHQFLELAQTHVHQVGDAIQPSHPLSSLSPPAFNLSQHQSFPRSQFFAPILWWPKYWSFSFSVNLSNEYSGLISFMIDWFDLLAVQGTPKSLLHHHSSKASFNLVYPRNEDLWTEIINLEKCS